MDLFERYFQNNSVCSSPVFPSDLSMIVIIPVFDDPDIFRTLESLSRCRLTERKAGVLIVVNYSETCEEKIKIKNQNLVQDLRVWVGQQRVSGIYFEIVEAFELPVKYAGVGLARKIAMDRAAWHFYQIGQTDCPIASLDADTWVAPNYLEEIIYFFKKNPVAGITISYAHRLDDLDDSESVKEAMVKYELYLRYYQQALQYIGHPYAYTCIGSAFAVRAIDYVALGGMNKRQAGEDFYFLQKLISTGRFNHLATTCVYPSARFSNRTPFGTGQSVRQIVEDRGTYLTYHFDAFRDLKFFFNGIGGLYKSDLVAVEAYFQSQPRSLQNFLNENDGLSMMAEINANCASEKQYIKRFFDKFNAFRVLKYLNYAHPAFYSKMDIDLVVDMLFSELGLVSMESPFEKLKILRKLS